MAETILPHELLPPSPEQTIGYLERRVARLAEATESLTSALEALLREPHGCPFCDSGKLRNPEKDHAPTCGYALAPVALHWHDWTEPARTPVQEVDRG